MHLKQFRLNAVLRAWRPERKRISYTVIYDRLFPGPAGERRLLDVTMSMRDPEADPAPIERHPFGSVALAVSVAGVVRLGLFPEPILGFLRSSAGSLF